MSQEKIAELKRLAAGREIEVLSEVAGIPLVLLDGKHHPCPRCGGKDRFRLIDEKAGAVFCNQCFNSGNGDFIDAVAWMWNIEPGEALVTIENYLHGGPKRQATVTEYFYTNTDGERVYKIKRTDKGYKDKTFSVYRKESGKWVPGLKTDTWKNPFVPFLYRVQDIQNASIVLFVEGEKNADIVADKLKDFSDQKNIAVTTISGGSNNWKYLDYFKEYFEGKFLYLLLDNDQPGEKAGRAAIKALRNVSLEGLFLVRFPDGPKGFDVGDWLQGTGKNFSGLERYIDEHSEDFSMNNIDEELDGLELLNSDIDLEASEGQEAQYEIENEFDAIAIADVTPEKIEWLWENKIPLGMVTLLAGRGGEGKSYFAAYLAARISRGGFWADHTPVEKGCTVYLGPGEDPLAQVVRPRLDLLGADTGLISEYRGVTVDNGKEKMFFPVSLKRIAYLKAYCNWVKIQTGYPVKLVVIDPVSNFLEGVKENSNSEIRELFKPLVNFAQEENVAVLLISHFRKGSEATNSIERVIGSAAFTTAVRAAWFLYANKSDKALKVVVPAKANILVNPVGLEFRILEDGSIYFTNTELDKNAEDIDAEQALFQKQKELETLQAAREQTGRGSRGPVAEAREAAQEWLKDQLKNYPNGREVKEVMTEAKEAGFSWSTISRAANCLNVQRKKMLTGWVWSLP